MATQKYIDDLITFIEHAEDANSVTNEMISSVLEHLNSICKANSSAQAFLPVHMLNRIGGSVKNQAYSLTSRKIKKFRSRTPLICARKILTLELKASADALVALRRK